MAPLGCIWHAGSCVYYVSVLGKNAVVGKDKARPTYLKQHMRSCLQDLISTVSFCALLHICLKKKESFLHKALTSELGVIAMLISLIWMNFKLYTFTTSREPLELKRYFGLVGEGGWLLSSESAVDTPLSFSFYTGLSRRSLLCEYCDKFLEQNALDILNQCSNAVDLLQLRLEEAEVEALSRHPSDFVVHYLNRILYDIDSRIPCDRADLRKIANQITLLYGRQMNMSWFLKSLGHSHNKSMGQSLPFEHREQPFDGCLIQASDCRRFFARETNTVSWISIVGEEPRPQASLLLNYSFGSISRPLQEQALNQEQRRLLGTFFLNNTMRNTPRPPEPLLILDLDLELAEFLPKPPPPSWGG